MCQQVTNFGWAPLPITFPLISSFIGFTVCVKFSEIDYKNDEKLRESREADM